MIRTRLYKRLGFNTRGSLRNYTVKHHHYPNPPTDDLPTKVPIDLSWAEYVAKKMPLHPASTDPILCLHGLFGSKTNYRTVGRKMSADLGCPVYSVDLRNHGDSGHNLPMDNISMVRDVESFIKKHNLSNVTVIGHSMGAKVAMLLALVSPERIKNLVVVDNSPLYFPLDKEFYDNLDATVEIEDLKLRKSDPRFLKKADEYLIKKGFQDGALRLFLLANLTKGKTHEDSIVPYHDEYIHFKVPVKYMKKQDILGQVSQWPEDLTRGRKFAGNTLILKAKHSNFIIADYMKSFEYYYPKFRYEEFDTGHWLVSEQPDRFVESVVKFIRSTV